MARPDWGMDKCPDCGYKRMGCDCDTVAEGQRLIDKYAREAYEAGKKARVKQSVAAFDKQMKKNLRGKK